MRYNGYSRLIKCGRIKTICNKKCQDPNKECWKKCKLTFVKCFTGRRSIREVSKCIEKHSRRCAKKCVSNSVIKIK